MTNRLILLLICLPTCLLLAQEEEKKDKMVVEYNSVTQFPTHGVTMAGALKAIGVTLEKIDYIKLVGDESSMTLGQTRKMKVDKWFWDRFFETAEPYKYWRSSGNRRLEIYLKNETKPKTKIFINETDSCTVEGDPRALRYMCHGLHRWFGNRLSENPN